MGGGGGSMICIDSQAYVTRFATFPTFVLKLLLAFQLLSTLTMIFLSKIYFVFSNENQAIIVMISAHDFW